MYASSLSEFNMKKQAIAAALLCAFASGAVLSQTTPAPAPAAAPIANAQGPWMVRARAVYLDSANGDTTPLNLSVNSKWIPEVDISYFFNRNVAAELILTVPQKHTLSAGATAIGSLRHLPPTLTLQYHFADVSGFTPYLGAGVNFTRFSSVSLPPGVDVKRSSAGLALQAGVDIPIAKNMYLNFDLKKVYIRTDVSAGGVGLGTFKVDPTLFGVGLGWRF